MAWGPPWAQLWDEFMPLYNDEKQPARMSRGRPTTRRRPTRRRWRLGPVPPGRALGRRRRWPRRRTRAREQGRAVRVLALSRRSTRWRLRRPECAGRCRRRPRHLRAQLRVVSQSGTGRGSFAPDSRAAHLSRREILESIFWPERKVDSRAITRPYRNHRRPDGARTAAVRCRRRTAR